MLLALLCLCSISGAALAARFDKGLLWKIERPGVAASYLFGTIHSDDPAVSRLAAPVQQAFERSATVILELELDVQTVQSLTAALLLPEGMSLETVLGAPLYARAASAMAQQGVPEQVVARMKAWAVAVSLMMPPAHSGVVLDQLLYLDAVAANKWVEGLETAAEQTALFDQLPQRDQNTLLENTLDQLPGLDEELAELLHAWSDRDLGRLMRISESYMQQGDARLAASLRQRVIVDRNARMAQRLQQHLREGRCFIAVGALHLPGEQGLLNLLERRGYEVSRLY